MTELQQRQPAEIFVRIGDISGVNQAHSHRLRSIQAGQVWSEWEERPQVL